MATVFQSQVQTIANTTVAYAANEVIGAPFQLTVPTLSQGFLNNCVCTSSQNASSGTTTVGVFVFSTQPTGTYTDHSLPVLSANDAQSLVSIAVSLEPGPTSSLGSGSHGVAVAPFLSGAGVTNPPPFISNQLWAVAVAGAAFTLPVASDLTLQISGSAN